MKIYSVVSESNPSSKILSKEAFRDLLNEKIEEVLEKMSDPLKEIEDEIIETQRMIDKTNEETAALNKAADVMSKHGENFLLRNNVIPKRTVGVNVNIVPKESYSGPLPEAKNYTRFPAQKKPCQTSSALPSTRSIKIEPNTTPAIPSASVCTISSAPPTVHPVAPASVHPVAPASVHPVAPASVHPVAPASVHPVAPTPSARVSAPTLKRGGIDFVDLTAEDERPSTKQVKTFAAVDKPGTRLLGALTREPISSKSQPVLIQDGAAFPPKFTAVPVSALPQASPLPQILQLTPSQLSALASGNMIFQQQASIPKTVATSLPSGQRITYLVQSNGFSPQSTIQSVKPGAIPATGVATARFPLNNSLISATRGIASPNSAIIVTSKLPPGTILSPQTIGEPRVVRPVPSNVFKHPAPLPEMPKSRQQTSNVNFELPPKPTLKITKPNSGIVLSWNLPLKRNHAPIKTYKLYAYEEISGPPDTSLWKKIGEVNALPLPMACTLTQFGEGRRYHFAIQAMDIYHRVGPFSDITSFNFKPASGSRG